MTPRKKSTKRTVTIDHTPAPCYDSHFGSIREAISELVNNSVQATALSDSRIIQILIINGYLLVMDNGIGMNQDTIIDLLTYAMNLEAKISLGKENESVNIQVENPDYLSLFGTGANKSLKFLACNYLVSTKMANTLEMIESYQDEEGRLQQFGSNKSKTYKSNIVIYNSVEDSFSERSNVIEDTNVLKILKTFQEDNKTQFTTFAINLKESIRTALYTGDKEILKLPYQLSDAHFFQLEKNCRFETIYKEIPSIVSISDDSNFFNDNDYQNSVIDLNFQSISNDLEFNIDSIKLPIPECGIRKTLNNAKDIFFCVLPIPITLQTGEIKICNMKVAILYLPFEQGNETKKYSTRYHWQNHFLSACNITDLSFFPTFRKSNSKHNSHEDIKLLTRITILGFVNYLCPILSEKTNILTSNNTSLNDIIFKIKNTEIKHFWDKCPEEFQQNDIKSKFSQFLKQCSKFYDNEILLDKLNMESITPILNFHRLNYKDGKRILNHNQQIIIKDCNSIERFIQIISFTVNATAIDINDIDSSYTYSGNCLINYIELPLKYYGQIEKNLEISIVDFTNDNYFLSDYVSKRITTFEKDNEIWRASVIFINYSERCIVKDYHTDRLTNSKENKVIEINSKNDYNIMGFQVSTENGNYTWFEDHGINPNPIPLSLHVSICSDNHDATQQDEIIYDSNLDHNHFKSLEIPIVNSRKLKNIDDCYYLDNFHFGDNLKSEKYCLNIEVLNSAGRTVYTTYFPIHVIQDNFIAEKISINKRALSKIRINQKIIEPIIFMVTNNKDRPLTDRQMKISLSISSENFKLLNNDLEEFPCTFIDNEADNVQYITVNDVDMISGPNMGLSVVWKTEETLNIKIQSFKEEVFQLKFVGTCNANKNPFSLEDSIKFQLYSDLPFQFEFLDTNFVETEDLENKFLLFMTFNKSIPEFNIQCYDKYNNFAFPLLSDEKWSVSIELKSDYTPLELKYLSPSMAKALYKRVSENLLKYLQSIKLTFSEENHGQLHFANPTSFEFNTKCRLGDEGIIIIFNVRIPRIKNFCPFPLKFKIVNDENTEKINHVVLSDGTRGNWSLEQNEITRTTILQNIKIKIYNSSNVEVARLSNDKSLVISCNWGDYNIDKDEFPDLNLKEENDEMLENFNLFGVRKESLNLKVTVHCKIWGTVLEFNCVINFKISIPSKFENITAETFPIIIKSVQSWQSVFEDGFILRDDSKKEYKLLSLRNDQKPTLFAMKPKTTAKANIVSCKIPLTIKDNKFHVDIQDENDSNVKEIISTLTEWKIKTITIDFVLTLQYNDLVKIEKTYHIQIMSGNPKRMKLFHKNDKYAEEVAIFHLDMYLFLNDFKIKFFDEYDDEISSTLLPLLTDNNKLKFQSFRNKTLLYEFEIPSNGDLNGYLNFKDFDKLVFDSSTNKSEFVISIEGQYENPYCCKIHDDLEETTQLICSLQVVVTRYDTTSNLLISSSINDITEPNSNLFKINEILKPVDKIKWILYDPVIVSSDMNNFIDTFLNLKTDNDGVINFDIFSSLKFKLFYSQNKTIQFESSSNKLVFIGNLVDAKTLKIEDYFNITRIENSNKIHLSPKNMSNKFKVGIYQIQVSYKEKRSGYFNKVSIQYKHFEGLFSFDVTIGTLSDIFWKNVQNSKIEELFSNTEKVTNMNLKLISMLLILQDKNSNVIKDPNYSVDCILFNVTTQLNNNKLCLKSTNDGIVKLAKNEDLSFALKKHDLEIVETIDNSESFVDDQFHIKFRVYCNNTLVFSKTTPNFNYDTNSLETERDLKIKELDTYVLYLKKYEDFGLQKTTLNNLSSQNKTQLTSFLKDTPAISYFCKTKNPVEIFKKCSQNTPSLQNDSADDEVPEHFKSFLEQTENIIGVFNFSREGQVNFNGKFLFGLISVRQEFFHLKKFIEYLIQNHLRTLVFEGDRDIVPSELIKELVSSDAKVLKVSPLLLKQNFDKHPEDFIEKSILSRIMSEIKNEEKDRSFFVITVCDTLLYDKNFEMLLKYFFRSALGDATFIIEDYDDACCYINYRIKNKLKPANILVSNDNIFISNMGMHSRFNNTDLHIRSEKSDETTIFSFARSIIVPLFQSQNDFNEKLEDLNKQIQDFEAEVGYSPSQVFQEPESFLKSKRKELNDLIEKLNKDIDNQEVQFAEPIPKKRRI